jgi:hypothetical protein
MALCKVVEELKKGWDFSQIKEIFHYYYCSILSKSSASTIIKSKLSNIHFAENLWILFCCAFCSDEKGKSFSRNEKINSEVMVMWSEQLWIVE